MSDISLDMSCLSVQNLRFAFAKNDGFYIEMLFLKYLILNGVFTVFLYNKNVW